MKTCSGCNTELPVSEFNRDAQKRDGLTARCKTCRRADQKKYASSEAGRASLKRRTARWIDRHPDRAAEIQRSWRDRHPSWSSENNRKWRQLNPDRAAAANLRRRRLEQAAVVGDVDLDAKWIEQHGLCGLCSLPIDRTIRHPDRNSPSVDHIVPLSKGGRHEQANVQWAHLFCNLRKGVKTPDQLQAG